MKNFFKACIAPLFGIIALVAVIGFSMVGCELPKDEFPSEFIGTWERAYQSVYTNTLTFTSSTLKDSTQNYYWELQGVSGNDYTIKSSNSDFTYTSTIKFENGNLRFYNDNTTGEHDWVGVWKKR